MKGPEAMVKRCAVYARVSTDQQGESLDNQVDYAREYIRRLGEGFLIDESCIYTDFDLSGYYTRFIQRPAIQQALADAHAKRFDVLVFKEISRISRDQAEHIEIVSRFAQYGVRIVAINDNLDSDRPETLDLLGIHSVMAEMESKRISSRVSAGKKSLARRGFWVGEPPIGYCLDPHTRRLEPDPAYEDIPQTVFRLFVQERLGTHKIAAYLNGEGRLTKNGRLWSRTTVARVLKNPAYTGDLVYGRSRNTLKRIFDEEGYRKVQSRSQVPESDWVVIADCHPPLVDRQTFTAAQRLLQARSHQNPGRSRHPLTGILQCGRCGAGMVCQQRSSNGVTYRYYTCSRAFRFGRTCCDQPNLPAGPLERAVWSVLIRQIQPYQKATLQIQRTPGDTSGERRRQLKRDRAKVQLALERLLLDTELPPATIGLLKSGYAATLKGIDQDLQVLDKQAAAQLADGSAASMQQFLKEWGEPDFTDLSEIRRRCHELVSCVVVEGRYVTVLALRHRPVPICSTDVHPPRWGCLKNTAHGPSSSG